jgi:hypothetical protein
MSMGSSVDRHYGLAGVDGLHHKFYNVYYPVNLKIRLFLNEYKPHPAKTLIKMGLIPPNQRSQGKGEGAGVLE